MHGLCMFMHRVLVETLDSISKYSLSGRARRILDARLARVCSMRSLHGPEGKIYRTQKTFFSGTNMTATDKVALIFLLPHVLGPKADMLPETMRVPFLTAVAHAQLIMIASNGFRAYTENELEVIFDRGYKHIFGALETICLENHKILMERHRQFESAPAPKRFKRQERTWDEQNTPATDTQDTDDDSKLPGLGNFPMDAMLCLTNIG